MVDGFLKHGKNEVVSVSQITSIWVDNDARIYFTSTDCNDNDKRMVKPEYEANWRQLFDLND